MNGVKAECEMTRDPEKQTGSAQEKDNVILAPEAQEMIAQRLRAAYSELLNAPLPDRFAKLLDDLSKAERANSDER